MGSLKFGVNLLPYGVPYSRLLEATLKAEELGFDSVWLPDHLQRNSLDVLECWSALSALAAQTTKIRLGTSVTCALFRHPSLLAKMGATLDQVSHGRLELGLGAGYDGTEFSAYGIPFPPLAARTNVLRETVKIVKALWTNSAGVNHDGQFFRIHSATCQPEPLQKPHPPIWVAGRSRGLLELAATEADGLNVVPYSGVAERRRISSIEDLAALISELDALCQKEGRMPAEVSKLVYTGDGGVILADNQESFDSKVERYAKLAAIPPDRLRERLRTLSILYGSPQQVASELLELKEAGFDHVLLQFHGWPSGTYDEMEAFADKVVTTVRYS